MEVIIKGEAEEIAALVLAVQKRQGRDDHWDQKNVRLSEADSKSQFIGNFGEPKEIIHATYAATTAEEARARLTGKPYVRRTECP